MFDELHALSYHSQGAYPASYVEGLRYRDRQALLRRLSEQKKREADARSRK